MPSSLTVTTKSTEGAGGSQPASSGPTVIPCKPGEDFETMPDKFTAGTNTIHTMVDACPGTDFTKIPESEVNQYHQFK
jgi:hypothetical protein